MVITEIEESHNLFLVPESDLSQLTYGWGFLVMDTGPHCPKILSTHKSNEMLWDILF